MTCDTSKGVSISLSIKFSIRAYFIIIQGIVTYKRGRLSPRTISILMTLKSWSSKDEIDNDVGELGEDDD